MKYLLALILTLLLVQCSDEARLFEEVANSTSGLDFANTLIEHDDFNMLDYLYFYNGGGVALGDINEDGRVDIFLSGNQVSNKLFLNKGGMVFEDISAKARVQGGSDWNTGSVMGDVNGDGLLDIYVCAVVGLKGLGGHNELYINNGDLTFSERSQDFGLDFETYSSSAAFLDYDMDGDLDIYLLNHAIHTPESFGNAALRLKRSADTGDKLLRNDGARFVDVSEEAGIYGSVIGYGLGVSIADFNQDGFPDIYVGNDFHEDDYLYLNQGDGTFKERLRDFFTQTTRFSMGCDAADINHDGRMDLLSLDMLPQDEVVLKSSGGDDSPEVARLRVERFGYYHQFSRNMLQVNQPSGKFSEVALMSGIAATDWSWSALFGDYNQDGEQDLFIANGIPRRPNDMDYIRFVSSDQIKQKMSTTRLVDRKALDSMPSGAVTNFVYEGTPNLTFIDRSAEWMKAKPSFSTAIAQGDLDNDGDLDLVINNLNGPVALLKNKTNDRANYLKVRLKYKKGNPFGIGAKAAGYQAGVLQLKELFTARGFQASSEPMIHFGLGQGTKVDSLVVIWPDGTRQSLYQVSANQTLEVTYDPVGKWKPSIPETAALFQEVAGNLGIDFVHKEDRYLDFNRQNLMPYQVSDRGPATAVGDLNHDGKPDFFFGGSKYAPSQVFLQGADTFYADQFPVFQKDSIKEEVVAIIQDLNGDGRDDLLVGTGGADFYNKMKPLTDTYYLQTDSGFRKAPFPDQFENASVLASCDYDKDGDLDVFLGNQSVSNDFGNIPASYLMENVDGAFVPVTNASLEKAGMVTDAIWDDYDQDGDQDLLVVGEWMSPTFFENKNKELQLSEKWGPTGLWQSVAPFDIDQDGDTDYLLGNWGLNSKYTASEKFPLKMYYADFDENGSTETLVATAKNGVYYPLEGLDGLAVQMIGVRKTYTSYHAFAGKSVPDIIRDGKWGKPTVLAVEELRSGYLENVDGQFEFKAFAQPLQLAPIMDFCVYDFDSDGRNEALAGGNYFGVKPFHGRLGSFPGALIERKDEVLMGNKLGLDLMGKSVRNLNVLSVGTDTYLFVTIHNENLQVYKLNKP